MKFAFTRSKLFTRSELTGEFLFRSSEHMFVYMLFIWDVAVVIRSAHQFLSEQFNCM